MSFVIPASEAIKNTLMVCREGSDFEIAEHAIIELLSAFEMTDEEIAEALNLASGNSAIEDECIDRMISNL